MRAQTSICSSSSGKYPTRLMNTCACGIPLAGWPLVSASTCCFIRSTSTPSGARYQVTFCTKPGMKARCCMMPFIDEAKRLLRIAGRDYQTFTILRNHPEAELAPTCFHAQQAIEKALKAVLTIKHIDFRRTYGL